jgi:hypothetical protein
MARKKRVNRLLSVARIYVSQYVPELKAAPLQLRMLDGPPGSPSCAVMAETCVADDCPNGIPAALGQSGQCPVRDCPLRCSLRLLLDRGGAVMHVTRSGIHWN